MFQNFSNVAEEDATGHHGPVFSPLSSLPRCLLLQSGNCRGSHCFVINSFTTRTTKWRLSDPFLIRILNNSIFPHLTYFNHQYFANTLTIETLTESNLAEVEPVLLQPPILCRAFLFRLSHLRCAKGKPPTTKHAFKV